MKCGVDIASTLLASYVVGPKMGKIASKSIGIGEEMFKKNFGSCRFIHNQILDRLNYLHQNYKGQYKLNYKLTNNILMRIF